MPGVLIPQVFLGYLFTIENTIEGNNCSTAYLASLFFWGVPEIPDIKFVKRNYLSNSAR